MFGPSVAVTSVPYTTPAALCSLFLLLALRGETPSAQTLAQQQLAGAGHSALPIAAAGARPLQRPDADLSKRGGGGGLIV